MRQKQSGFILPLIIIILVLISLVAFTIVVVKANTEKEGRPFDLCQVIKSKLGCP